MDLDRDPEIALGRPYSRDGLGAASWKQSTSADDAASYFTPKTIKPPPATSDFTGALNKLPQRAEILELMRKKPPRAGACGLFRFDGQESSVCGGRVGKDESGMCVKPRDACTARAHQTKKAWKAFDGAKEDGAYFIRYARGSADTVHISPSLPGPVGDSCPIIQKFKNQLASIETWTSLFRMSLENHSTLQEEDKLVLTTLMPSWQQTKD